MKLKSCLNLIVNNEEFVLSTDKLLVGSSDTCDITISHDSVSHYHAMIFVKPSGTIEIIDLSSNNGTFVNGSKLDHAVPLFEGDTLTFGKVHCSLIENISSSAVNFESQDSEVQEYAELQVQKMYIPEAANENEILIDDEFCDIKFDDEDFTPLTESPLHRHHSQSESYIPSEEFEHSFDLLEQIDGNCVQVTTALRGNIIEQSYYPLQDGTVFASNKSKRGQVVIDVLAPKSKEELFKISGDQLSVPALEGFNINKSSMNLTDKATIVITQGTYQIFIEVADVPNNLIHISPLKREEAFFKDSGKKFAAALLPLLLILLVDFSPEEKKPLKQLSIIYKKATTANVSGKKMASSEANSKNKNTGHKSTKQPDKKIAHSKSGKKAQPKKAKQQKVAKAQSKKTKTSKTKAKTKAYSFKMASNVSSVFSNSKSVSVTNSNSPSSVKTTSTVSGSLSTKVNGTSSNNVGNMGSDSSGRSVASFGSKGLSSKSGRDTAYIQTETVVLGSMDPELLRKILQQYLPQFRHCYQQELAYNSDDIKGIVDLNFEIKGSGKVSKIRVKAKDSRFSKKGTDCMAKVLAIIDFPKPKGGGRVAVRQPLSFYSEKEKS